MMMISTSKLIYEKVHKDPGVWFLKFRLQGRVDKMESSITPMSHKIDIVLARLDGMFKKRKLKKEDMEKIFEGIVGNSEGE